MKPIHKIALSLAAVIALVGTCSAIQQEFITSTYYTYTTPKLPQSFKGFRICHLSDLHNKLFGKNNSRLLESVASGSPDIIVITGDLVDERHSDPEPTLDTLEALCEIAPVYYVCGNHEKKLTKTEQAYLFSSLEEMGVTLLDSKVVELYIGYDSISLGGVFDGDSTKKLPLFEDDGRLNILLYHKPGEFDAYKALGADLVLSGHAHGGQVRIPFIGGAIAPDQWLFPKYSEGSHTVGEITNIISRGLGNSLIPLRVNNPPEVVFITLE